MTTSFYIAARVNEISMFLVLLSAMEGIWLYEIYSLLAWAMTIEYSYKDNSSMATAYQNLAVDLLNPNAYGKFQARNSKSFDHRLFDLHRYHLLTLTAASRT
jgi:hypothetical protein